MRFTFLFLFFLCTFISSLSAAENTYDTLIAVRSLKCQFPQGTSGDWKGGTVKIEKSEFGSPFHFDSIDIKGGKARLIGNQGTSDLIVIVTGTGLTFVETTGLGNLTFTTVFPVYAKGTRTFIAVHSRHIDMFGEPLSSQYHGTCQIWE